MQHAACIQFGHRTVSPNNNNNNNNYYYNYNDTDNNNNNNNINNNNNNSFNLYSAFQGPKVAYNLKL